MRLLRIVRRTLLVLAALLAVLVVLANRWVVNNTEAYLYTNWALLPENDVGLVLGTSPFTSEGQANPHFQGRIAAAVELYKLGRIKHLIVSGANPDATYNEPRKMWQALTAAGVPAQAITMDFAGFRTFDSVMRAQRIFGLDHFTLITQEYHAYRALFIAKKLHLHAVAYAPAGEESGPAFKPFVREAFARVWAIFDLFLLDTMPRFLGEPERLPIEQPAGSADEKPQSGSN